MVGLNLADDAWHPYGYLLLRVVISVLEISVLEGRVLAIVELGEVALRLHVLAFFGLLVDACAGIVLLGFCAVLVVSNIGAQLLVYVIVGLVLGRFADHYHLV